MKRVDFFVCAMMDGLETAENRAAQLGVPEAKVAHWKNVLRTALSPA